MTDAPKLKRVYRLDNVPVGETYYTDEGFLIDHPIVTTVGIFEYRNADGSIRRELRLPEEVFSEDSLASYKGKPVIVTHNAQIVNKDNVDAEGIGTMMSDGYRDGDNVRVEVVIHDTDRMKECGMRELSLGYNLTLDETPGEWNGKPYDAIQRNIRVNHLALVSAARAGENARLNVDGKDYLTGGPEMEDNKTNSVLSPEEMEQAIADFLKKKNEAAQTVSKDDDAAKQTATVDGDNTPAVVEDVVKANEDEDVVQSVKDRRDRRDAENAPDSVDSACEVIAQQDADINSLLEVIEKLKAEKDFNAANNANVDGEGEGENKPAVKTDEDKDAKKAEETNLDSIDATVDKIVAEKLSVCRTADKLNLDGVEGMSIKDGKKAIIKAVFPTMRLDGKSDAYIAALYDLTTEQVKKDSGANAQRRQMFNKDSAAVVAMDEAVGSSADQARAKMIEKHKKNGGSKK